MTRNSAWKPYFKPSRDQWGAHCVWIATAVFATGCWAHGASGTYIARGQGFVEMLQITQAQDGQLLGSLSSTTLKPNGSITRDSTNITGVADGKALTLAAKSLIPLIPSLARPGCLRLLIPVVILRSNAGI
jgi:hypothetical protein